MTDIDAHRPELHGFGFRAILEVARGLLGADVVEELVTSRGVTAAQLADPNAWFSAAFAEALIADIDSRVDDPTWLTRAMQLGVSPRYLGILYPLVHAFGTPGFTYRQIAKEAGRFNKIVAWSLGESEGSSLRMIATPIPGAPVERTWVMCHCRRAQLEAVPILFDSPLAEVSHPSCIVRGDPSCIYDVRWQERQSRTSSWVGLGIGVLAAAVLSRLIHLAQPALVLATFGVGGWAIGRTRELQRQLSARVGDLTESHNALARSTRAHEDRYEELLEAKAEVEKKVEQRTAELRQTSAQLSQTLEEMRATDRAKTDFFNNVSHELRSPLTMIIGPLEDLAEGRPPPGGAQTALDSMRRNAHKLMLLINQLLDLAKIDAGEMRATPVPTDLGALVHAICSDFEVAARRKGLTLELACPPQMPSLTADVAWIESAITNLVANAVRVTERGGVRVRVEDRGAEVTIAVADDGPGIAPENQAKIFERFAQGDVGKRVVGGTGIGLSLVREAARLHRGSVNVSSELGKGATFVLTLPRLGPSAVNGSTRPAAVLQRDAPAAIDDLGVVVVDTDRDGPSVAAPLVLIVEDDTELRAFMADVLAAQFRVRSAVDGRQGLVLARELLPEAVVSDVAMPNMDGYELCRALRADEQTNALPVLLVTARTEIGSVLEGFEAGASDYVLKPFHGRELLARVEVHVRLRQTLRQLALQERHAILGVMAASVAHQVRNPLTALVGGLPAIRERFVDRTDERTLELVDVMIDCAARIERMTSDLMNLSRVDRETESAYRPSDGLRTALRLSRTRGDAASVVIEEHIEDSPVINGRPGDMNHVFLNVLDNAIRAVRGGGTIHVEATVIGDRYVVRVGDSGPGVDPAQASRIFEPFFTTRAAGEGTGLGLGVAMQVLHACGGGIDVGRSELGGALFSIRIPLRSGDRAHEARASVDGRA